MIWFMILWWLTILALAVVLARHERKVRRAEKADHAKCIAHIASVVSHRVVAQAFRFAADDWDSIEGQADLQRLAREKYTPGGPSMPAIWMRERADLMERMSGDQNIFHAMTGERVL